MQRGNCRRNPSVNATVGQNFEVTKYYTTVTPFPYAILEILVGCFGE